VTNSNVRGIPSLFFTTEEYIVTVLHPEVPAAEEERMIYLNRRAGDVVQISTVLSHNE